jgi:hypothetical protein
MTIYPAEKFSIIFPMTKITGHKMINLGVLPEGDAGTAKTVQHLIRLIREGSQDPTIILTAREIVKGASSDYERAKAIFNWVKLNIGYVRDPRGLELIRPASKILEEKIGDCDEHVVLLNSLFRAIGLPSALVTISTPKAPDVYTHVYSIVKVGDTWYPVDTTVKNSYFGWEYPFRIKKRIWPIDYEKPEIGAVTDIIKKAVTGAYGSIKEGMKEAVKTQLEQQKQENIKQVAEAQERTNIAWMIFIGVILLLASLGGEHG